MKNWFSVKTNDGVRLNVFDSGGNKKPIVFLHGWSQTAALFQFQIEAFSYSNRVIAYDMRGHGDSEKPDFGYRISRLAMDLFGLLEALELKECIMIAHSMGCAVLWNFIDLFGCGLLSKLILVDQEACMISNPIWNETEKLQAGGKMAPEQLFQAINAFSGENGNEIRKKFISSRFTEQMDERLLQWVIGENLKMSKKHAAQLLSSHLTQDWRDLIPRIKLPTLIISGLSSDKSQESQEWIRQQIPDAKSVILSKEERGSHFMFLENPNRFNEIVKEFIQ